MLFKEIGCSWYVALLYNLFVFAGAMQFVTLSVLASGGSALMLAITLIPIGIRNLFYGLTMLERYQKAPTILRGFLAFCLVDGVYSVLQIGPKFDDAKEDVRYITWLSVLSHASWVLAALLGSFADQLVPIPPKLEFTLTALFTAVATEMFLTQKQKRVLGIAFASLALAILIMPSQMLLAGILFSVSGCLMVPQKRELTA